MGGDFHYINPNLIPSSTSFPASTANRWELGMTTLLWVNVIYMLFWTVLGMGMSGYSNWRVDPVSAPQLPQYNGRRRTEMPIAYRNKHYRLHARIVSP